MDEVKVPQFAPGTCPSCHCGQHVGATCACGCPPERAIKASNGKAKGFGMIPWAAVAEIAEVFRYGIAKGYLRDSWRNVDPEEYRDALCRHLFAYLGLDGTPEIRDKESKLRHLAHMGWGVLALMVLDKRE